MAILFDKNLEVNMLYTVTFKDSKVSRSVLATTMSEDCFNFTPTRQAFIRFLNVLRSKGEFLTWDLLCSDQTIDETSRNILLNSDPVLFEEDEALLGYNSLDNYRIARILNTGCSMILEKLGSAFDARDLVEELSDVIMSTRIGDTQKVYHTGKGNNVGSIVKDILSIDGTIPIVKTGFTSFDSITGGLPRHGVTILASPTGGGKSTLGQQLALNMYNNGLNAAVITLEMGEEQYLTRILSNLSEINSTKIFNKNLTPKERKDIVRCYKKHVGFGKKNGCRLSIYSPKEDVTLGQALMAIKVYGYDVIVLDYIGLFKGMDVADQWKAMRSASREAKRFSDVNKCLILLLAQLDDKTKDLRYSKGMKDDADNVWIWSPPEEDDDQEDLTVQQIKGRNSPKLDFVLKYDFSIMSLWDDSVTDSTPGDVQEGEDINPILGTIEGDFQA